MGGKTIASCSGKMFDPETTGRRQMYKWMIVIAGSYNQVSVVCFKSRLRSVRKIALVGRRDNVSDELSVYSVVGLEIIS